MYTITNDGRAFFDPRLDDYKLESPHMSLEAEKIGSLSFTVYPNNPEYNSIVKRKGDLRVYLDGDMIARFRPIYSGEAMQGGVNYQCEELIARLNDLKRRPGTITGTPFDFISTLLTDFNTRNTEGDVTFYTGNISNIDNSSHTYEIDDYMGYWDIMVEMLPERIGGYLKPRYVGDVVFIDFLSEEDLPLSTQRIVFGENLADKFYEQDADTTFSVLIPLGAQVDDGSGGRKPLTIASVNGGKDYLENASAIAQHGRKELTVTWNGIENASELKAAGQAYLAGNANQLVKTTTLDAYDLRNTGADIRAFRFLERVNVVSLRGGAQETYPNTRMDVPLGIPLATTIQVGRVKGELSTVTSEAKKRIDQVTGAGGSLDRISDSVETERKRATNKENELSGNINVNAQAINVNAQAINVQAQTIAAQAQKISLVVSDNNTINAASIVLAINQGGSSVVISADHIDLRGYVTIEQLSATNAEINRLITGSTTATTLRANAMYGSTINTQGLWVHNGSAYVEAEWKSMTVVTSVTTGTSGNFVYQTSSGTQHTRTGSLVTGVDTSTIYYLGR